LLITSPFSRRAENAAKPAAGVGAGKDIDIPDDGVMGQEAAIDFGKIRLADVEPVEVARHFLSPQTSATRASRPQEAR
jgi:hypothetical protein